jgi:hypothetical protein
VHAAVCYNLPSQGENLFDPLVENQNLSTWRQICWISSCVPARQEKELGRCFSRQKSLLCPSEKRIFFTGNLQPMENTELDIHYTVSTVYSSFLFCSYSPDFGICRITAPSGCKGHARSSLPAHRNLTLATWTEQKPLGKWSVKIPPLLLSAGD